MDKTSKPATIQEAYQRMRRAFQDENLPTPDMDAGLLLEHATGITVLRRMTDPRAPLNDAAWLTLSNFIERRLGHEPVHRIIGAREFYGLALEISEATLVPRPDTEILVDTVLPFVHERIAQNGHCDVLDLGTGTGAIALAILSQAENARATGVDISQDALNIANKNAKQHRLQDRFTAQQSNWFSKVAGQFDLIVSNPPYIASSVIEELEADVRDHDPRLALDGGADGLNAYGIIAAKAQPFLKQDGRIAVEIGYDQKQSVSSLFEAAGFRILAANDDLSGQNRVLLVQ